MFFRKLNKIFWRPDRNFPGWCQNCLLAVIENISSKTVFWYVFLWENFEFRKGLSEQHSTCPEEISGEGNMGSKNWCFSSFVLEFECNFVWAFEKISWTWSSNLLSAILEEQIRDNYSWNMEFLNILLLLVELSYLASTCSERENRKANFVITIFFIRFFPTSKKENTIFDKNCWHWFQDCNLPSPTNTLNEITDLKNHQVLKPAGFRVKTFS